MSDWFYAVMLVLDVAVLTLVGVVWFIDGKYPGSSRFWFFALLFFAITNFARLVSG